MLTLPALAGLANNSVLETSCERAARVEILTVLCGNRSLRGDSQPMVNDGRRFVQLVAKANESAVKYLCCRHAPVRRTSRGYLRLCGALRLPREMPGSESTNPADAIQSKLGNGLGPPQPVMLYQIRNRAPHGTRSIREYGLLTRTTARSGRVMLTLVLRTNVTFSAVIDEHSDERSDPLGSSVLHTNAPLREPSFRMMMVLVEAIPLPHKPARSLPIGP